MNKVCVKGQRIYFYRPPEPIPKSQVNFSRIEFDMDETWSSFLSVVAQFIQNGEPRNVQVEDGYCFVPSELEIGAFELCLRGDDGESVVASVNRLTFEVCEGFDPSGETPLPPSPDLYTQLIKEIDSGKKIAQSVRYDADAGLFNGKRGTDGGWYTPSVTQTDENTLRMAFTPSKDDMPDVAHTSIMLPGGGGTSDHSKLSNRNAADQHPMSAITGLQEALEGKQPTGNYLTDKDLDATLAVEGKAADAKVVGYAFSLLEDAIVELSEKMLTEESDPTVPSWAKEHTKPSYTAAEIGAQPDMYVSHFGVLLNNLAVKTVVYVAAPGGTSPIPADRYPVLFMRGGINMGYASIVAYDAAGKAWTGSVNFAQGTINLSERTLTASDIGAIPVPATAEVGQTIVVKAVDEDGKPTEWETQDMANGSADKSWRLIRDITTEEDVRSIVFDTDDSGNGFELDEIYICTNATNISTQTAAGAFCVNANGKSISFGTTTPSSIGFGKAGESGRNWMWMHNLNPLIVLHGVWVTTNSSAQKNTYCIQPNIFGESENPYAFGEKISKVDIGCANSGSTFAAGSRFLVYGR